MMKSYDDICLTNLRSNIKNGGTITRPFGAPRSFKSKNPIIPCVNEKEDTYYDRDDDI